MEICFVAGEVEDFVTAQAAARPERFGDLPPAPAQLVDAAGAALGEGGAYYRYTVGQRRGLGLAAGRRRYVLQVLPAENRVVVGDEDDLLARGLAGERLSWIGEPPAGEVEVTVRIRSRHEGVAARVRPLAGGRAEVELAERQRAVAPGQAAVFYAGTRVLGGCWIERALG
jgi:tRNA-specific 2-thiouridylase